MSSLKLETIALGP